MGQILSCEFEECYVKGGWWKGGKGREIIDFEEKGISKELEGINILIYYDLWNSYMCIA